LPGPHGTDLTGHGGGVSGANADSRVSYLCNTEHPGIGKENPHAEGKHCSKSLNSKNYFNQGIFSSGFRGK